MRSEHFFDFFGYFTPFKGQKRQYEGRFYQKASKMEQVQQFQGNALEGGKGSI